MAELGSVAASPESIPASRLPEQGSVETALGSGASRRRRLALVINCLLMGGAETQVSVLARAFAARDWEVAIFSVRTPEALVDELEAAGVSVHTMNLPQSRRAWVGSRWITRELRRFHPDVVHSHMYRPNIWMRLLRPFVRPPVLVCTAHNTFEGFTYTEGRGSIELLYRLTDRLCDLTTNVSRIAVERYIRLGAAPRHRIRYVPNAVDTQRFRPDPAERAAARAALDAGGRPIVLTVGRFAPQKNYPLMLEAFVQIRAHRPDALLLMVGDGSDEYGLGVQHHAAALGLGDSVRFLGLRTDIPALMNAADVFAMSSDWEGLPMVLLEASAAGLPMVVTDVGGNAEIVEDGVSGFVVPTGHSDKLAAGVLRMLALPEEERQRMGAAARTHVDREYSIDQVTQQWEAIYSELSGEPVRR